MSRKFLHPRQVLTAAVASLSATAGHAAVPDASDGHLPQDRIARLENAVEAGASIGNTAAYDRSDVNADGDMVVMHYSHTSHASHQSHTSHYSSSY